MTNGDDGRGGRADGDGTSPGAGGDGTETYLVAFDGSAASRKALRRADRFADRADARLIAVAVLPSDEPLAAAYGLSEETTGGYDPAGAVRHLRDAVGDVAPAAAFRTEQVDGYAGRRRIALEIRRTARAVDADLVFVGTDAAGRVLERLVRVVDASDSADPAANDDSSDGADRYDVVVVRSP